jgi:rare lipoprotein A (peptidoglycan hydrolase)
MGRVRCVVGLLGCLLLIGVPASAQARWKTYHASTYGGPKDHGCSWSIAAPHAGKLAKNRNIVAHKKLPFGTLIRIRYRRWGKWYYQLMIVLDRGPYVAGRQFDASFGLAGRLHFSGVGHIQTSQYKKRLPKRLWRKFKNYKSLAECQKALHWK